MGRIGRIGTRNPRPQKRYTWKQLTPFSLTTLDLDLNILSFIFAKICMPKKNRRLNPKQNLNPHFRNTRF